MARPKLKPEVTDKLMFDNDHTCCICRKRGKQVQIHHTDGNNANNKPQNLAVVCTECHGIIESDAGHGRRYTPPEVRFYKRTWEAYVKRSRGIPPMPFRAKDAFTKAYWSCEVRRLAYCAMNAGSINELERYLDTIETMAIYEWIMDDALYVYEHILSMEAFSSRGKKGACIVRHLAFFVAYTRYPEGEPLGRSDIRQVNKAIRAWQTMGNFNAEFGKNRETLKALFDVAIDWVEVAVARSISSVVKTLISGVAELGDDCLTTWEKGERPFKVGKEMARQALTRIGEILKGHGKQWASCKRLVTRRLSR